MTREIFMNHLIYEEFLCMKMTGCNIFESHMKLLKFEASWYFPEIGEIQGLIITPM